MTENTLTATDASTKFNDLRVKIKDGRFEKELTSLLNRYSIDNCLEMPDFILSEFLVDQLDTLQNANKMNYHWHNGGLKKDDA